MYMTITAISSESRNDGFLYGVTNAVLEFISLSAESAKAWLCEYWPEARTQAYERTHMDSMADSDGLVETPEKITAPESGELPEGFVSTCQEDFYDTVLIPYGITEKEQDNYVLTSYVNDTNRENAETLMEYGTDGFVSNVYEYGRQRNRITAMMPVAR